MACVPHMCNTDMHGKISAKTERSAVKRCYYYYSAVSLCNKPKYMAGNHRQHTKLNSQFSPSSSVTHMMSRLFSKTTHFQNLIFERINLVCLSSFAFGIVCSCLPWGSEILEKKRLLRMAAIKFTHMLSLGDDPFHNNMQVCVI